MKILLLILVILIIMLLVKTILYKKIKYMAGLFCIIKLILLTKFYKLSL